MVHLVLHERRTRGRLVVDSKVVNSENLCVHCGEEKIDQLEPLKPNVHGLKDDHGHLMMEQRVVCKGCNEEWVDVFCRVYPELGL